MKDHDNIRVLLSTTRRRRALATGAGTLALIGTLSLTAVLSGPASAAPAPAAKSAAAAVSLTGWNLTLPVDSAGCQCGAATEISPATLKAPWLVRNSDGSLTFWAPTKGAHTPHSLHPRTELVSRTDFTAGSGTHTLTGTFIMQKMPSSNDIMIGQIHGGGSSSSIPLLMLHYRNNGQLIVVTRKNPTSGSTSATVLTGIPMNAAFSYTITQSGMKMTVTATYGGKHGSAVVAVPASFRGMDVRFQAGDYQQNNANNSATDGGRLTVTALSQN
ncbi:polysaccharide lyase family 7 protein [Actinocrinis sp.]|uniref:polysaccharide lyase family 7 protein n=1 Tax=Actinocrinis sp. TaxID=1920516 RepID=UPI002BB48B09|nr:polysaccharide lyase family 7 protein [Actinocrinis sp.]HXR71330.1 polysaccharide lyase family 7 protein [Actinocrinis sp.]